MRNFRKIILRSLLLVIFVSILLVISVLPYFNGEKYYYQDYKVRKSFSGTLDTLVIGSSHALRSVKSAVLNDELNVKSYNMSSPLMSMYGRYVLFLKEAKRNPIKNIFIEISYNALTLDRKDLGPEGDLYVLGRLDNTTERVQFFKTAFTTDEYRKVFSDTIKRSKNSLERPSRSIEQYKTYGYLPVYTVDQSLTMETKKAINNSKTLDTEIKKSNLKYLDKLIEYCHDNDIRVILIVTPVTEKMILRYKNLDDLFSQYVDLAKKYNCEYYDFNLDKERSRLYSEKESFYDIFHTSDSGAQIFTIRLAEIIKKVDDGKDVSNEFYNSYDEVKKTILKQ